MSILSFITFGLSALSFLVMRIYESKIAGWAAVVFGFIAIGSMTIVGLQRLRDGKIAKSQN
ncbi:MAG: hypothetical protein WBV92_08885 [Nitrosotalea sp.]